MDISHLCIKASTTLASNEPDLGAKIMDGVLYLPIEIYEKLSDLDYCQDSKVLLSALQAFPDSLSRVLGWKKESVQHGYNALLELITIYNAEEAAKYHNYQATQHGLGAQKPRD